MKEHFVEGLKVDQEVNTEFAVLRKGTPMQYKNKDGQWFGVQLADKTGTIEGKFWGEVHHNIPEILASFTPGDIVSVSGKISEFRDKKQIGLTSIAKINQFDVTDFMKKTTKDISQMISNLKVTVSEISDPHIKLLLEKFLNDDSFMEKYARAPAGKMWHHDFVGGLLEHVSSLIEISKTVKKSHPELNLDLLIAACILHDIGKTVEYSISSTIQITKEGRFMGHISIGFLMVGQKISEIADFPEELREKILHIILSHHGELEHGSPVKPMFTEAVAFAQIDDTDAKTQHYKQLVQNNESGEDWIYENDYGGSYVYLK